MLFIIFIYDLSFGLKSNFSLFANDLKMYQIIETPEDTEILRNDLNHVIKWSDKNLISLNTKKCCFMENLDHSYLLLYR